MGIIDELEEKAGGMGGIVNSVLGMTDLDEKAIVAFDEKLGAGRFEELKAMLADGRITKEEIVQMATEAGVPEMVMEMIMKFI